MSTRTAQPARRRLAAIAAAAAAALLATAGPVGAQARAPASSSTPTVSAGAWGTAIEVPGIAALNTGRAALIEQMSCPSAGTCAAGGWYTDSSGAQQVFLVSEVHGTWGKAEEIPGTAALNAGGGGDVGSVSCASAGNCSIGGSYRDSSHRVQAFVINEVNGTWGTAKEVPGTAALNQGGSAEVISMSCATAGNCSAGGFYAPVNFGAQAFVVSEVHGTWGKAREVPGIAALGTVPAGQVSSVSCATAGNCGAGGFYSDNSGQQAFVVTQTNGTWGKAREVPGTAALNQGGSAEVNSVSCAAAGGCSAGGAYYDGSVHQQSFVASQANGTWGKAREVPGTAALNQSGMFAGVASVSCPAVGTCAAGGSYTDGSGHQQAFVASQTNGTWGKARELPGTATLNKGNTGIGPLSCASAGNCDAGGTYVDGSGHLQVFVDSEVNGTWGTAEEIPGTATLNQGGDAVIGSLSCTPAGTCSAGGQYAPGSGVEAFVVNKT
jgi:hypothetical protein